MTAGRKKATKTGSFASATGGAAYADHLADGRATGGDGDARH